VLPRPGEGYDALAFLANVSEKLPAGAMSAGFFFAVIHRQTRSIQRYFCIYPTLTDWHAHFQESQARAETSCSFATLQETT
jgi:hypothetical protein